MARRALALLLLLGCAAPALAAADAYGFEDLARLQGRLVGALDADVGQPGGPVAPIDRRLKLKACPANVTIDPPALGAVALRCEPLGWRIRVPLVRLAGTAPAMASAGSYAPAQPMQPMQPALIKRGDPVELVAASSGFSVSTDAVAQEDGRLGGRIRVKPDQRGPIVIGEVVDSGRVRVSAF
jgi:flagella basal body P-ring formation protein FlgA